MNDTGLAWLCIGFGLFTLIVHAAWAWQQAGLLRFFYRRGHQVGHRDGWHEGFAAGRKPPALLSPDVGMLAKWKPETVVPFTGVQEEG